MAMDEEIKAGLTEIMIQVEATKLLAREALAAVAKIAPSPAAAIQALKHNIKTTVGIVETAAIRGDTSPEFRKWFAQKVEAAANVQIAVLEGRVLGQKPPGARH